VPPDLFEPRCDWKREVKLVLSQSGFCSNRNCRAEDDFDHLSLEKCRPTTARRVVHSDVSLRP
jgi:hypothetical protein